MADLLFFSKWGAIRAKRDRNERGEESDSYKTKTVCGGAADGEKIEGKVRRQRAGGGRAVIESGKQVPTDSTPCRGPADGLAVKREGGRSTEGAAGEPCQQGMRGRGFDLAGEA